MTASLQRERPAAPRTMAAAAAAVAAMAAPLPPLARADDAAFAQLVAGYGNLTTVAGTGLSEDTNAWQPGFEGAPGTTIELSNPHMTMADAAGNLYIADKESHSVLVVTPDGTVHTFAGTHSAGATVESGTATEVPLNNPNGLYVFPDGTVFVLDLLNQRVRKVTPEGALTTVFHDPAGFGAGRALWVSPDETTIYYAAPGAINLWTPDAGSSVAMDGLLDPGNIDVDPDGRLVVTDRGAHRVFRLGDGGTATTIAGTGGDGEGSSGVAATSCDLNEVRGVAFLPDGTYFLATMKGGDIWYVDGDGIIHLFVEGRGNGNAHGGEGLPVTSPGEKISEPRGVSVGPGGDVIITCNDTGFVRVVPRLPELPALGISLTPGDPPAIVLRWQATAGQAYRIETSTALDAWAPADTVTTSGDAPVEWMDPDAVGPARQYRLALP